MNTERRKATLLAWKKLAGVKASASSRRLKNQKSANARLQTPASST